MLADDEPPAREQAARALGTLACDNEEARLALLKALGDKDAAVRVAAVRAVAQPGARPRGGRG